MQHLFFSDSRSVHWSDWIQRRFLMLLALRFEQWSHKVKVSRSRSFIASTDLQSSYTWYTALRDVITMHSSNGGELRSHQCTKACASTPPHAHMTTQPSRMHATMTTYSNSDASAGHTNGARVTSDMEKGVGWGRMQASQGACALVCTTLGLDM